MSSKKTSIFDDIETFTFHLLIIDSADRSNIQTLPAQNIKD
jgi:hypothetical protein